MPHCILLLVVLLTLLPTAARADSSILIWPIDPTLAHDQRASALWLENHGDQPALLQVRILAWSQRDGEEHYQAQREVIGSPPMLELQPGARQLVRLTRLAPSAAGSESAYRILIDEVPTPRPADAPAEGNGVRFQMRYSVPLFLHGAGLPATAPTLGWRPLQVDGRPYLEIHNPGPGHARLTRVRLERGASGQTLDDGLLGYVLAGSRMRWPLPHAVAAGSRLWADVNGQRGEIAGMAP